MSGNSDASPNMETCQIMVHARENYIRLSRCVFAVANHRPQIVDTDAAGHGDHAFRVIAHELDKASLSVGTDVHNKSI